MSSQTRSQLKGLLGRVVTRRPVKRSTLRSCARLVLADQRYELLLTVRSEYGRTAVHYAAYSGDVETVRSMLGELTPHQRYDILKVQESVGVTALHLAAFEYQTDVIRYLLDGLTPELQAGLIDIQNEYGRTVLDWAIQNNHTDTVIYLNGVKDTAERIMRHSNHGLPTKEDLQKVIEEQLVHTRTLISNQAQQEDYIQELRNRVCGLEKVNERHLVEKEQLHRGLADMAGAKRALEGRVTGLEAVRSQLEQGMKDLTQKAEELHAVNRYQQEKMIDLEGGQCRLEAVHRQLETSTSRLIEGVVDRFTISVRAEEASDSHHPVEEIGQQSNL